MTDYRALLAALNEAGVEYILIGGLAASAHGSPRFTLDVDVVYRRSEENFNRIVDALRDLNPYLRGAPPGLPFHFDVATLRRGLNFTLQTSLGFLDLLGEVAGGGTYESLLQDSELIELYSHSCRVTSLDRLIALKRAAGRVKDLEAIAELEAIREHLNKP